MNDRSHHARRLEREDAKDEMTFDICLDRLEGIRDIESCVGLVSLGQIEDG